MTDAEPVPMSDDQRHDFRKRFFDMTLDFYFYIADRLSVRQDHLFRTYLWVASLFISLNILILKYRFPLLATFDGVFCSLSIAAAVFTISICIFGLRGVAHHIPNMKEYYDWVLKEPDATVDTVQNLMWDIISGEREEKKSRVQKLKAASLALLISLVSLLLGSLFLICQLYTKGGDKFG